MAASTEETPRPTGEARIIKRYANRKLYDTRDSRYVTLQQIAQYVRGGEEVQIIDNNSKEDLTNVTLAQIIYEEEKKGEADKRSGTVGTLRGYIQLGGERLMTSLREGPVGRLITRREGAEDEEPSAAAPGAKAKDKEPAGESPRQSALLQKSREALDELSRLADGRVRALVATAIAPIHHLQAEVRRLQARIDELEATLVRISRKPKDD